MGTLRNRLGTLRNRLGTLRNRLGTLRNRLGTLRNRLGTLRNRLGTLRNRFVAEQNRFRTENREQRTENREQRTQLKRLVLVPLLLALTFFAGECPSPEPTKFTITFNSNEGSTVANIIVVYGNKVTKPADPTRAGHAFGGWYKDNNTFASSFNFDTETITASITLFAKWEANSYTVTFNTGDGGSIVPTATVTHGNKVPKPADPTLAGHAFGGWYKDNNTFASSFNFETETITANITLYAKWAITYTVTFNSNEGSAVASITVTNGNKATKPTDPTRVNYVFVGWYKETELITAFNFDTETITADITLYAKWAIAVTSIAFDKTTLSETYIGKKIQITATVSPDNAANKDLTWTSSNETVASVTTNGLITTLAKGNATITATSKDGSKISTSVTVNVGPYFYIPDDNFRNKLRDKYASWFSTIDGVNGLDITKANEFTGTLDVKSSDIANLSGIEYFTAITTLWCSSNQLQSLDVSKNVALTTLWCNNNKLQSLDVSKNVALTTLYCSFNQLTSLDVSKNEALTTLLCHSNQLTSLDVRKNVALTILWCHSNQLTSLDVSNNVRLTTLYCYSNQLQSLDLRGMRSVSDLKITTTGAGTNNNSGLTSIKIHKSVGIITSAVNTELKEVKKLATSVQIDVYDGEGTNASHYTSSICDYDPDTGAVATSTRACK
ncbi:hypothetical protein CHS0354_000560 [Potamilus streckersoni]|uniref:BIG2 domain-containing protein n=1 Tax=Potamilus streckersoni TaxID=2493646 RepID=A0AAE0T6X7_9BIVA|nr:hypothetical protein CHS0354_000560 [Potamilus streckersoni]